jgi:hypothetical protein
MRLSKMAHEFSRSQIEAAAKQNALAFASRWRERQLTIDHGALKLACRARFHDRGLQQQLGQSSIPR